MPDLELRFHVCGDPFRLVDFPRGFTLAPPADKVADTPHCFGVSGPCWGDRTRSALPPHAATLGILAVVAEVRAELVDQEGKNPDEHGNRADQHQQPHQGQQEVSVGQLGETGHRGDGTWSRPRLYAKAIPLVKAGVTAQTAHGRFAGRV